VNLFDLIYCCERELALNESLVGRNDVAVAHRRRLARDESFDEIVVSIMAIIYLILQIICVARAQTVVDALVPVPCTERKTAQRLCDSDYGELVHAIRLQLLQSPLVKKIIS